MAAVLVLALPAGAHAFTLAESLRIADRWAESDAPGHVNHCSGGRLNVSTRADLGTLQDGRRILGQANGWVLDAGTNSYVWDHARCQVAIRADLTSAQRCRTIAHELMHYVTGPEHVGPLDPRHPGAMECYAEHRVVSGREPRCGRNAPRARCRPTRLRIPRRAG